jgi:hypothetical protein
MIDVKVRICGCDDTTEIVMKVTEEQYNFLLGLEKLSELTSTCICQPIIKIVRGDNAS